MKDLLGEPGNPSLGDLELPLGFALDSLLHLLDFLGLDLPLDWGPGLPLQRRTPGAAVVVAVVVALELSLPRQAAGILGEVFVEGGLELWLLQVLDATRRVLLVCVRYGR